MEERDAREEMNTPRSGSSKDRDGIRVYTA